MLKARLLQCYQVLWIHNIDAICMQMRCGFETTVFPLRKLPWGYVCLHPSHLTTIYKTKGKVIYGIWSAFWRYFLYKRYNFPNLSLVCILLWMSCLSVKALTLNDTGWHWTTSDTTFFSISRCIFGPIHTQTPMVIVFSEEEKTTCRHFGYMLR